MKLALDPARLAGRLRFWAVAAGWPGAAGLALVAAAAAAQFLAVPQQEAARAAAQAAAESGHLAYLQAAERAKAGAPDAGESLAGFRERLASRDEADATLELIQHDAQSHRLAPSGTEYKWQDDPDGGLVEVRIAFTAKGGYAALRAFVQDVLADVPGLALEQFDLQRDNIAAADAEARLRFLLFLKSGS